jgi:flavin reductase (DIM6/NTAB) family NADH-FMN oxidoreductase RutF
MQKNPLDNISYGMYALGVNKPNGTPSGCIVNTVTQVCTHPEIISVCVNRDCYSNVCIKKSSIFSVSIFTKTATILQIATLGFASGRDRDKLSNLSHKLDPNGSPILTDNICGHLSCKVISEFEASTHTVFYAEVLSSEAFEGDPLTYDYYRTELKGKSSTKAPHSS